MQRRGTRQRVRRIIELCFMPFGESTRIWWIHASHYLARIRVLDVSAANRLASLPPFQAIAVPIDSGPGSFLYVSPEWDRLNSLSVANFVGWESRSRLLFSALAKESQLVVDVGAYTGVFSLIAAASSPGSRVWAFEPFPRTYEALVDNIEANDLLDRILPFSTALGFDERDRFIDLKDGDSSMATVADHGSIAIKQTTLDQVVQAEWVDLIKVDAEGAEFDVLRGSSNVLARCQPTVVAEALSRNQWEELNALLSGYGYLEGRVVGTTGGDERNFVWVVPRRSDLVTKVLDASPGS